MVSLSRNVVKHGVLIVTELTLMSQMPSAFTNELLRCKSMGRSVPNVLDYPDNSRIAASS